LVMPRDGKTKRPCLDIGVMLPAADNPLQPVEQAQLDSLAAIIEACREHLRPKFGKARRGFYRDRDQVDTMEWDELLVFAAFDVIKLCKACGAKPAELVELACKRWPLTNNRALAWASFFFRYAEHFNSAEIATVAIELRNAVVAREKAARVARATAAANLRHAKPDGSRDTRNTVLTEWASGKYADRNKCAEAVAKRGHMSIRTARDHSKGAPDPANWNARTSRSRSSRSST